MKVTIKQLAEYSISVLPAVAECRVQNNFRAINEPRNAGTVLSDYKDLCHERRCAEGRARNSVDIKSFLRELATIDNLTKEIASQGEKFIEVS
jgi:hypothetical protein